MMVAAAVLRRGPQQNVLAQSSTAATGTVTIQWFLASDTMALLAGERPGTPKPAVLVVAPRIRR